MNLPHVVNRFNMYKSGKKIIGITGEVKLPEINQITSQLEGAGVGGNIDIPVIGLLEEMETEIPFMSISKDTFAMMDPTEPVDLMLCGSIQASETGTGAIGFVSMSVYLRGTAKKFVPGSMKAGNSMNSSVTVGLSYYKIVLDGKDMLEIDKFNGVYCVNGHDVLAAVRNMC